MTAPVNLLKLFDRYLSVNCRRFQIFVTKKLLDEPDIRSAFQKERRAGVPEQMTASGSSDLGLFDECRHLPTEYIGVKRAAVASQEQCVFPGIQQQLWPNLGKVTFHPTQCPSPNRNHPVFLPFALSDLQREPVPVQIRHLQIGEFSAAQAAGIQNFEDSPVT